jgi:tetratricopeptide (TPR) repeat protein
LLVVGLLVAYLAILPILQEQLRLRALVVKLGYTPTAEVLKVTSADHRYTAAEWAVLKVLFYFGSTIEKYREQVIVKPEYLNMYRTLVTAVQLDPYNMDAYYFMQSAFTWEVGRVNEVNSVLEYGMKYRTWDWYLPYFIGFNEAYFLKNYAKAGEYMRKAAEISGNDLFTRLATRYFFEAGQVDLGLSFLDVMIEKTRDPQVRELYRMRRQALLAARELEDAVAEFRRRFGVTPKQLQELVTAGLIDALPADPYGGRFYLDPEGRVRTTSKFAVQEGRPGRLDGVNTALPPEARTRHGARQQ